MKVQTPPYLDALKRWSRIGGKALRLTVNAFRVQQLKQFIVHLQHIPYLVSQVRND